MVKNNSTEWIGTRYGRLEVTNFVKAVPPYRGWRWVCRCDCGNTKTYDPTFLKRGVIVSCGCSRGNRKHRGTGTRLHNVWIGMKQRCYNPNSNEYHRYGGRGISVCESWLSYENFREWAIVNGYDEDAPRGECTLDRIDNDGNYEPSNCRWVDMRDQIRNRPKRTPYFDFNGESHTLYEWANRVGIGYMTLKARVKKGVSIEKALTIPIRKKNKQKHNILC